MVIIPKWFENSEKKFETKQTEGRKRNTEKMTLYENYEITCIKCGSNMKILRTGKVINKKIHGNNSILTCACKNCNYVMHSLKEPEYKGKVFWNFWGAVEKKEEKILV